MLNFWGMIKNLDFCISYEIELLFVHV